MKQIAQNYRTGDLSMLDVPVPTCRAGGILVRTEYSLLSAGTEMMKVREGKLNLIGKARARPDQVKKVLSSIAQQGLAATLQKVTTQLDSYTPLGYSLCGRVVEIGEGVTGFRVGQRVAAAGNAYALHAEYNWVPVMLCVPVDDQVDPQHAAFTTVAAIALQGLRQADARLGETAVVVGLGLLGQILVQLLHSAGLKVFGIDLSAERCALAVQCGAIACVTPDQEAALVARILPATAQSGADHVFLSAGGPDNGPIELASRLARDRARITDIGKCSLNLAWNDWYEKELELRFSRSYGPGRYDPNYEEKGIDYPIGYVRWTERRNLACIIDLIASGGLDLRPLITRLVPFEDAVVAYEQIHDGSLSGLGLLFAYQPGPIERRVKAPLPARAAVPEAKVRLGVIGAGNYATSMLLPHFRADPRVSLLCVATATGLSGANAMKRFGFAEHTTDYRAMLDQPEINAVLIATRHSQHARMTAEALRAGKIVFVEKPLALNLDEIAMIEATIAETGNDRLMVGFNRRFSPMLSDLKAAWGGRSGPQVLRYRINAGALGSGSWYGDRATHGSRFIGEGGHFIDAASYWLEAEPVSVYAIAAPDDADNITAIYGYADGSRAEIAYLTGGDGRFPKELIEIMGQGKTARLDNFRQAECWDGKRKWQSTSRFTLDKGQRTEITAFVTAVTEGSAMPIPLASLLATSRGTILAEQAVRTGQTISLLAAAPGVELRPALVG